MRRLRITSSNWPVGSFRGAFIGGGQGLFRELRPRPYGQTDAMVSYGFLDPQVESSETLLEEIEASRP